ncbi:MAG: Flp pilus assembly protein CpaB [Candidatus Omnitrophota bacterium]
MPLPLQKQQIYLISGVVLALAALFMIKVYLDKQRYLAEVSASEKFKKIQASQISVLVAKDDIVKGKIVEPDNFTAKIIPNQFVQPGAVTSLDRISGMISITNISKGEQITLNKFAYAKETGGLSEVTPMGKRAITISVDNISSLAGMIKAGDHVDVIALIPNSVAGADGKVVTQLITLPIFQNVLVLAIGQQTSPASSKTDLRFRSIEAKQETNPLITLALIPQEASLIAFVQEQGKIRLTMRSPTDTKIEPVVAANWESLFQYVFPERIAKPQKEEQHKPGDYVEIYRGLNKEKVLLTK